MTDSTGKPMDPNAREGEAPEMYVPTPRNTYGMDQLIEEVETLFPGTIHTVGNRNQRGVAFDVQFTPYGEESILPNLLTLIQSDQRVRDVVADAEGVRVTFVNSPTIQDLRDPFGLADAHAVLFEGSDPPGDDPYPSTRLFGGPS